VEFFGIMNEGGFDVIIGNPPYVEYNAIKSEYKILDNNLMTGGNLHSMVFRRCVDMCSRQGSLAMIVPVAITSTDRMHEIRNVLSNNGQIWASSYAIRPGKLFTGAEQRLSIVIARKQKSKPSPAFTTKYIKWNSEEREHLFEKLSYLKWSLSPLLRNVWAKLNSEIEHSIIQKIQSQPTQLSKLTTDAHAAKATLYYKNTGIGYFVVVTTKPPICYINGKREASSRETELSIRDSNLKHLIHCLLNSSMFFLTYQQLSNCRDLNPSDIGTFRIPESLLQEKIFTKLSDQLQDSLEENSWYQVRKQKQTGEVKIQSFTPSLSKPIIDEIDRALARHYGLTEEELDFIINYDIKYRMGASAEEEGEE
jgi:hypothetical protein